MNSMTWRDRRIDRTAPTSGSTLHVVTAVGDAEMHAEDAALRMGTSRIYRLRTRHPLLYGLAAFVIGGGLVALFTMSTYANWAYQSIDLKVALYRVVLGGLGGGAVLVVLAFAYAASVRSTCSRGPRSLKSPTRRPPCPPAA
jgi:hypothetical protein